MPGLRKHAKVTVSLTPVDFAERTYQVGHHSFGGVCPIMGKSGAPHRTPIDGLWFLGAQSETAGGVAGVTVGARTAVNKIRKAH